MANLKGYKPKMMCDLLGVSVQTLRYWRKKLEPEPKRAIFSSGDLLAFRIIKVLIQRGRFTVEGLLSYNISEIFSYCNQCRPENIAPFTLVLNENDHSIEWVETVIPSIQSIDTCILSLSMVVEEQMNAFSSLGDDRDYRSGRG